MQAGAEKNDKKVRGMSFFAGQIFRISKTWLR